MLNKLSLESLINAYNSLEEIELEYSKNKENSIYRDAYIQRFEYTYDLAFKTLRKFLKQSADIPSEIDKLSFKDLIIYANSKGINIELKSFLQYREYRNITSHTYSLNYAIEVVSQLVGFRLAIKNLIEKLREYNKNEE